MRIREIPRALIHLYWRLRNETDLRSGRRAKHIVICGYPRSGTSLLFNMISASAVGFHCEKFEKLAIRRLHRRGNYVTKFPLDVLNVDEILSSNTLSKDIYFIVLIRDVRDLVTSRHPMVPDRYFIGYRHSLWPKDPTFSEWRYEAPGIQAVYKAIQDYSMRSDVNLLKLRYESLVGETDRIQEQIEDFVGIRFVAPLSDYYKRRSKHAYKYTGRHKAKNVSLVRESERVDASRISKWRSPEHANIIREEFSQHPELFDILINDGYEPDKQWFMNF